MYNIKILSKCEDEKVQIAIISAINMILSGESNFKVHMLKRTKVNVPVWSMNSRQENLNNKF